MIKVDKTLDIRDKKVLEMEEKANAWKQQEKIKELEDSIVELKSSIDTEAYNSSWEEDAKRWKPRKKYLRDRSENRDLKKNYNYTEICRSFGSNKSIRPNSRLCYTRKNQKLKTQYCWICYK